MGAVRGALGAIFVALGLMFLVLDLAAVACASFFLAGWVGMDWFDEEF